MSTWISIDDSLKEGVKVIEQVDSGKLKLLANRICQSLQIGLSDKIFSAEEEAKLMISLCLEKDELEILLRTLVSIYRQAAFNIVKPAVMESTMKKYFTIGEDKISVLLHVWILHAKEIIDSCRHESLFPAQVEDINWNLDIQVSSSTIAKISKPTAKLQLDLNDFRNSKVTVEMDKHRLSNLYRTLETIQMQLDLLK